MAVYDTSHRTQSSALSRSRRPPQPSSVPHSAPAPVPHDTPLKPAAPGMTEWNRPPRRVSPYLALAPLPILLFLLFWPSSNSLCLPIPLPAQPPAEHVVPASHCSPSNPDHPLLQSYDLAALLGIRNLALPPPPFEYDTTTSAYITVKVPTPEEDQQARAAAACRWPQSIWATYHALASNESVCDGDRSSPYFSSSLLRHAMQRYSGSASAESSLNSTLYHLVHRDTTLVVQLSPAVANDTFTNSFLLGFDSLAVRSSFVLFVATNSTQPMADAIAHPLAARIEPVGIRYTTLATPVLSDELLALIGASRHLLVHAGDDAALAAVACTGTVYHDHYLINPFSLSDFYKWSAVRDLRDVNHFPKGLHASDWVQQLRLLIDVRERTCCDIEHFGKNDGEKYICTNTRSLSGMRANTVTVNSTALQETTDNSKCWILSIGCGGLFDFERLVTNRWKQCVVHLFDCTKDFVVPSDLAARVTLHKLCVAPAPLQSVNESLYVPLNEMIRIGSAGVNPGSKDVIMPALFKFDAEGVEYEVLDKMLDTTPRSMLPKQMIIEFHLRMYHKLRGFVRQKHHYQVPFATASALFEKLGRYGYSTVFRADNPVDEACTELTMVLDDDLPMPKSIA